MFSYDPDTLVELETYLSPDRLTKYMRACSGNLEQALALHVHNTRMSSMLYAPLQGLEITLRNALTLRLRLAFPLPWYDDRDFLALAVGLQDRVHEVKEHLSGEGVFPDEPHIIAKLPFGFWVMLLGKGRGGALEQRLWRPHLRYAFPNVSSLSRKDVHKPLDRLRKLRNRIAHHEPIFSRDLFEDYERILQIIGWINLPMQEWVRYHHPYPVELISTSAVSVNGPKQLRR